MSKLYESRSATAGYNKARALPEHAINLFINVLKDNTPVDEISRVLDLGGGTGRFSPHLQSLYKCPVYTLDPSIEMLQQGTAQHFSNVYCVGSRAEYIPLKDSSIDLVFMAQVYHHLEDKQKSFAEIRRILKDTGYLVIRNGIQEDDEGMTHDNFFPESVEIDKERIPSRDSLLHTVESNGFSLIRWHTGQQLFCNSHREYYEKISHRGLSSLLAISDEAFEAGLKRLREWVDAQPPDVPMYEPITHFFFRKS